MATFTSGSRRGWGCDSLALLDTTDRSADRGRRRDELLLISGALTLLTNAVIAFNTWKLNEVLERRRAAGRPVRSDDILVHVAPIAFSHINFRGIYRFPIEQYLDRLLPSASLPMAANA